MRQASRRITAAILGAATALGTVPASAETLTDALVLAYNNSDLLERNRAVLRATDEDVAQAVANLRPTLGYSISETAQYQEGSGEAQSPLQSDRSDTAYATNFELTSDFIIWAGGRNRKQVESAKEAVLAARQGLITQEQDVLLSAVQAYMNVIAAQETVAIQVNSVRVLREELRAANDRFDVGEVTRTDVAQARAALAEAEAQLVSARGDLEAANEDYNLAVGQYPGELAPPPPLPQTAPSEETARDIALRIHPSILEAQRQVRVSIINATIAERQILPALRATGSLGYSAQNEDFPADESFRRTGSVGLEFSGPIYQGGGLNAAFRQAKAQRDQTRAALLRRTAEISRQLGQAWAQRTVAAARLEATARQIDAAQSAFEGLREEATLGARTTLDVLDAEQDLLDARAARIEASAQQQIAAYALLSAMGRLTVDYLDLPVIAYDPSVYYSDVADAPSFSSERGIQLDKVLRSLGR